jgi:hypothetical protein
VKYKALWLFISFVTVPAVCSFGQVNCTTSTKLICEFPVSAQTLGAYTIGAPASAAAQSVGNAINASVATQLTQLPIPSASIGVVSLRQKGQEATAPFDNLGPLLTDRPDTVGKGHVYAGFSYQHFNFNSVNGISLGTLPVTFTYAQQSPANAGDLQVFYGSETNRVQFTLDQEVGMATYGVTKSTDVSLVVPYNEVQMKVTTYNFSAFFYDSGAGTYTNESPAVSPSVYTQGSSSGLGDMMVILKQQVLGGEGSRTAVAGGVSARFPTGDSLNLLGSGAFGGNIFGLFEYRARIAPHVKIGYQWNNKSQLVNLNALPSRLPGGLQFASGVDAKINRTFGASFDILGTQFVNSPSFSLSNGLVCPAKNSTGVCVAPPAAGGAISQSFNTETTGINTYTTVNVSFGVKWVPVRHFLIYGNLLKQANNVGLRSNLVPLVGIAFKR